MKKIFLFLAATGIIAFSSCEGPEGPRGPVGYNVEAVVYEITDVDFLPGTYSIVYEFPQLALQSDHVLAYRWTGTTPAGDDIWELLPQHYFFPDGTRDFSYNFDHSLADVQVWIEGNDLETLSSDFTQNQILRFVVIPGYMGNKASYKNDYKSVSKMLNLKEANVITEEYQP